MGIAFLLLIGVSAVAVKNVIDGTTFGPGDLVRNVAAAQPSNAGNAGDAITVNVRIQDGYKYVMTPSTMQVGQNVRLVFDMSTVKGCMRSVNIPAFNIRKSLSERDNVIEFTPDKAGEFKIACSMNMGRGTFTVTGDAGAPVVNADDSINQVQGGGSCGSGGCGCGGA